MNSQGKRQRKWSRHITASFSLTTVIVILFLSVACEKSREIELFRASASGDTTSVMALIDRGINVNAREAEGETPLMYAATEGHIDVVKILLKRGADIDALSHNNETALARAVLRVRPRSIRKRRRLAPTGTGDMNRTLLQP